MDKLIPLSLPDIQEHDIDAVVAVLKSGSLVQGKYVVQFEQALASYLGVSYAVAVANGTAALHITLVALGIGCNDEVIVPAFSFIATANVVELVGAKPVFVDIELDSFNMDKNALKEKITRRTKAVVVVHEFGLAADIQAIKDICDKNNIVLIEDAACALGAKEGDHFAGTLGNAGCFSFHPRKVITSGEGGAIVTNDQKIANKLKALRNHGIDPGIQEKNEFILVGFNYRMTDFQATLLVSQLDRFDGILKRRKQIAERYLSAIKNNNIKLPKTFNHKIPTWQTFHIVLNPPLEQSVVIKKLRDMGIGVNYGAQCIPAQKYFHERYNLSVDKEFPNALCAYQQGLAIPLYERLSDIEINKIINILDRL